MNNPNTTPKLEERLRGVTRLWAGSIVYMRSGLAAASYFLGHKSQVTTERFYATWFQNAEALDGEAVGRALVAEAA